MCTDNCGLILGSMFYKRTIIHLSNPAQVTENGLPMTFVWSFASAMGHKTPAFFSLFRCRLSGRLFSIARLTDQAEISLNTKIIIANKKFIFI